MKQDQHFPGCPLSGEDYMDDDEVCRWPKICRHAIASSDDVLKRFAVLEEEFSSPLQHEMEDFIRAEVLEFVASRGIDAIAQQCAEIVLRTSSIEFSRWFS